MKISPLPLETGFRLCLPLSLVRDEFSIKPEDWERGSFVQEFAPALACPESRPISQSLFSTVIHMAPGLDPQERGICRPRSARSLGETPTALLPRTCYFND